MEHRPGGVQGRPELARVYITLADLAGAQTLMREIDDLLRRRPGLGTLAGQSEAIRAQLAKESAVPASRSLGADRCRAALADAPVHTRTPGDRRGAVSVLQHR
jgi:hypothetical protein